MAVALSFEALMARNAAAEVEEEVRIEGPYRVVLERLQRLVRYRDQMIDALAVDRGDQKAAAELVRVRHMIQEAHRAVSINAAAKTQALRIDPGEPAWAGAS